MSVLVVATLKIGDAEAYGRYAAAFPAVFARHDGAVVAADPAPRTLDGRAVDKIVILSFPDRAAAGRFLTDPDYRAISEDRNAGALVDAWMVQGYG